MVTTVAGDKPKYSLTLTDDAIQHIVALTGTPAFTHAIVQIVNSQAASSYSLEGSLDGVTYSAVGELVDGTIGTITDDGFLFYTQGIPMKLRLKYTAQVIAGDTVAQVYLLKPARQSPLGY